VALEELGQGSGVESAQAGLGAFGSFGDGVVRVLPAVADEDVESNGFRAPLYFDVAYVSLDGLEQFFEFEF